MKKESPAEYAEFEAEKKRKRREQLKEIVRYVIVGMTTTFINWGSAALMRELTGIPAWLNTAIAWILSTVFFAFWAYKLFVFRSKSMKLGTLVREFIEFIAARLFTLGFETLFMWIFVDMLGFDNVLRFGFTRVAESGAELGAFALKIPEFYVFKFFATIVVTVLNYVFSKLVIFRKRKAGITDDTADEGEVPAVPEEAPADVEETVADAVGDE